VGQILVAWRPLGSAPQNPFSWEGVRPRGARKLDRTGIGGAGLKTENRRLKKGQGIAELRGTARSVVSEKQNRKGPEVTERK